MKNKEMKERFDKKFPQLVENKKFKRKEPIANYTHYWELVDKKKSVLAFIQSEINLALANREKEIVEMIREYSEPYENAKWLNEVNAQKIINLITKDK